MKFSNYETDCVAAYLESNDNYINCINTIAHELRLSYSINECISILANSIRDICEYDIDESLKEASSLTRSLMFATLGMINFEELSSNYINSICE